MSDKKVIEFLERKAKRAHPCDIEYYDRAISALQERIDREKNEPLRFEELREMDGEPVWLVWPDGRIKSRWWIVGSCDWRIMEFDDPIEQRRYGKTWLAYRYKQAMPGEEA